MKTEISYVDLWFANGATIAKVVYNSGNIVKYTSDYGRDFPKTVTRFMDTHESKQLNSQCKRYE